MSDATLQLNLPINTFIYVTFGTISLLGQSVEEQDGNNSSTLTFKDSDTGAVKVLTTDGKTHTGLLVAAWLLIYQNEEDEEDTPLTLAIDYLLENLAGTDFIS